MAWGDKRGVGEENLYRKVGGTGKARSRHLREVVNTIAEVKKGGGEVKLGWVKAQMDILGNEATDVLVKNAAEGVPPDYHERWMSGEGVYGSGRKGQLHQRMHVRKVSLSYTHQASWH